VTWSSMRANVYLATGQRAEAVKVLDSIKSNGFWPGFSLPTTLASRYCRPVERRSDRANGQAGEGADR